MHAQQVGPRLYHDRHGHVLPPENSLLQTRLNQIQEYSNLHQLKINESKTKIMSFNFSLKYDFLPKMEIGDKQLEVVKSTKLLGIIISSDLKWNEHTSYTVKKAMQRLWFLRRLSKLGASRETLLDLYHLRVRSILELGVPVFAGGLSKTNIDDFEDVQRQAFKIILRGNFNSYENALEILEENKLEERRNQISLKFAKKCVYHPKMKHLFQKRVKVVPRSEATFTEPQSGNARSYKGPIHFLLRLLNNHYGPVGP